MTKKERLDCLAREVAALASRVERAIDKACLDASEDNMTELRSLRSRLEEVHYLRTSIEFAGDA